MEWELHWSEADNVERVVGVRPDNWVQTPIVGPVGACCTRARATCGLTTLFPIGRPWAEPARETENAEEHRDA